MVEKAVSNAFLQTLQELRGGRSVLELEEILTEVVAAVRETGKAGEIRLRLKLKPATKNNGDVLTCEDSITRVVPENDRGATIFYAINGGLLSRQDPRQMSIEEVKKPTPENPSRPTGLRSV